MTTDYSAAELSKLIEAANRVYERNGNRPGEVQSGYGIEYSMSRQGKCHDSAVM